MVYFAEYGRLGEYPFHFLNVLRKIMIIKKLAQADWHTVGNAFSTADLCIGHQKARQRADMGDERHFLSVNAQRIDHPVIQQQDRCMWCCQGLDFAIRSEFLGDSELGHPRKQNLQNFFRINPQQFLTPPSPNALTCPFQTAGSPG